MISKNHLHDLPKEAGVYQYYDKNETLIYVGKAKNIKKRVRSYFNKQTHNTKTASLIKKITSIKYIIVDTEMDALLLENNLIKQYQPKYNVLLKDGKTYPWICIKKEKFPKVFQTRTLKKDGSEYFGPYTSIRLVKTLLDFFHQLYPLRTCSLNLSEKNISTNRFSVCLEYHIGNCLGPCVGLQDNENYLLAINHIKQILNGDVDSVIAYFKKIMLSFSKNLNYEKAQVIKEKIFLLKKYQAKSTIVSPRINNIDVFTIVSENQYAFVNYLKISSGAIIQAHSFEIKKKLNETDENLLLLSITEIRRRFKSTSKNIYCSHPIANFLPELIITVPKIGEKKKLINLSLKNAKQLLLNRKIVKTKTKKEKQLRVLTQLKKDLHLLSIPKHIECFDNSNTQGLNPVSACVVFKNALPSKKEYRHFNIKTVLGPNDFKSMEEVVFRRYSRLLKKGGGLPQLIIVDGGKGQVSATTNSLKKLNLLGKIAVIGIAKRLEEIYFPNDSVPLYLNKRSESLKLIQQLRNEAHRFSLIHHRNRRMTDSIKSSLDDIKGIGPKTIKLLITHFGSVKKVLEANKIELESLIGKDKTNKLLK